MQVDERVPRERTLQPLAVTSAVAVISLVLLSAAVAFGWLGADVDRGGDFCEAARGVLRQPVNTASNLGFVVAGLAIAVQAGRPGGLGTGTLARLPVLATAYACLVVLLGPGSMAMHATETAAGGWLDTSSMYLVAAFVVGYAAMRRWERGPKFMAVLFTGVLIVCELIGTISRPLPVVMFAGNLAFGVALVVALLLERQVPRRTGLRLDQRWAWAALGTLLVAFAVWNTAKSGSPLCFPHATYQGHGLWHLLCAASAWLLFQLYVSERAAPAAVR